MEWNGMEWNGMEWNGMEWNGMKQNETEWNRTKQNEMDWNGTNQNKHTRTVPLWTERSRAERNGRKRLRSQSLKDYMHTRSGTEWGMEWNGMEWNRTKQNETEWNGTNQNKHTMKNTLNGAERSETGGRDWDRIKEKKVFYIIVWVTMAPNLTGHTKSYLIFFPSLTVTAVHALQTLFRADT
jgi:hypothetical protein